MFFKAEMIATPVAGGKAEGAVVTTVTGCDAMFRTVTPKLAPRSFAPPSPKYPKAITPGCLSKLPPYLLFIIHKYLVVQYASSPTAHESEMVDGTVTTVTK